MRVEPTHGVHPVFASWLERRRDRLKAQMDAIEDQRFDDLATLLDAEDDDRPPTPQNDTEREEYRRMLAEGEALTARLAEIRAKLLVEMRDVERRQGRVAPRERRSSRGGSLDGYV